MDREWSTSALDSNQAGWTSEISNENISLNIFPRIKNQLMDVSVTYWEGIVKIEVTKNNKSISGKGYVELT